jgi:hypothetical protein
MSHPTPGELLELHFGELEEGRRAVLGAHPTGCAACRAFLADLSWLEDALAPGPGDAPPADGLERVLARASLLRPARGRREHGVRALLPSLAAAVLGVVAAHEGGALAVLALFAAGALVTLALAPVLILESQRRPS